MQSMFRNCRRAFQGEPSTESTAHGHRGRRQAETESQPRYRAGSLAALGRRTQRAHFAADIRDRTLAGGGDQEARLEGGSEQFLQVVISRVPDVVQRFFGGAPQNRDPYLRAERNWARISSAPQVRCAASGAREFPLG